MYQWSQFFGIGTRLSPSLLFHRCAVGESLGTRLVSSMKRLLLMLDACTWVVMYVTAQPHQECQQSRLVCLTHRLESGRKSVEQILPDCAMPWQSSALELLLCTMPGITYMDCKLFLCQGLHHSKSYGGGLGTRLPLGQEVAKAKQWIHKKYPTEFSSLGSV